MSHSHGGSSSTNYRGRGDRSRSPLKYPERTYVKLNDIAIKELKEKNMFGLEKDFPDLGIRINEREEMIFFRGGNYRKKQVMMNIFRRLKNIHIHMPR